MTEFDNPGGADIIGHARRRARPRDAASLILWRDGPHGPEMLMGRRNPSLRFMPDVMVFPGGRVDTTDHRMPAMRELRAPVAAALNRVGGRARAIAVAAARELMEETALMLGGPAPDLGALDYLCRAVTPPDRPIRFNARFLVAPACAAQGTLHSSGELTDLGFYSAEAAAAARMAGITAMIMREFLAWHGMTPAARARRRLVRIIGYDGRVPELPPR
ncbi:MAG: NUDIX domain-containing protein [Alphaproteobacteria bacterium]|nr:NUDIX domain-containing protein [Alphaproteobacteria bacterium]